MHFYFEIYTATETQTVRCVLVMQQTCNATTVRHVARLRTARRKQVKEVSRSLVVFIRQRLVQCDAVAHQITTCVQKYMKHVEIVRMCFTWKNLWSPGKRCRVRAPLSGGHIWHSTQARSDSDTIIYIWRQSHKHTCLPFNTSHLFRFKRWADSVLRR